MKQEMVSSNRRHSPAVQNMPLHDVNYNQSALHSPHETIPDIQEDAGYLQHSVGI